MRVLKIILKTIGLLLLILIITYFLGPKPDYPSFDGNIPTMDMPLDQLDQFISVKESKVTNLKPNNHSRIIWADSLRKTNYCILYLHGFSASPMEGDPTHEKFAKRYGANLYIPRLAGHGIKDKDAFQELTPKNLVDYAKEAVAIARLLGDTLILMSCSTGSTLGNYLAAENPNAFYGHIMYSPNFDLEDTRTGLLTRPWGLQLARRLIGDRRTLDDLIGKETEQYTTCEYRVEGLLCLKNLLQTTMTTSNYEKVKTPYLIAYFYKDETTHDDIISIDAIKDFHETSATPSTDKQLIALPNVGTHVIPSDLYCKDLVSVDSISYHFAESVLGMKPL